MIKSYFYNSISIFIATILVMTAWWLAGGAKTDLVEATLGETPFGGEIKDVKYECCNGFIVTIEDVSSVSNGQEIDLMFVPGISTLYEFYQIENIGSLTLGNYRQPGFCVTIESECESVDYVDGEITIVGTSE